MTDEVPCWLQIGVLQSVFADWEVKHDDAAAKRRRRQYLASRCQKAQKLGRDDEVVGEEMLVDGARRGDEVVDDEMLVDDARRDGEELGDEMLVDDARREDEGLGPLKYTPIPVVTPPQRGAAPPPTPPGEG